METQWKSRVLSMKGYNFKFQSNRMFEMLHKKMTAIVPLTDNEFEACTSRFISKKLRKRHYLLQQDDVCKYQAFVEKGIMRSYTVDEKGAEHILQFACEGWWIADLYSFLTDEPSPYNIDALEDAELLLIDKGNWNGLMQELPKLEHYFRILLQNHLVTTQRRLMESLSKTAEQKYHAFTEAYPANVQQLPQHMIASYLGITRETLNRLRNK